MAAATERAIERVLKQGQEKTAAARAEGIEPSTLFRALKRQASLPHVPAPLRRFVVVGAGSLGRELAQWIRLDGLPGPITFLDDYNRGTHIAGTVASYERQPGDEVLLAVADPKGRQALGERIQAASWSAATAIAGDCRIGTGSLLLPRALISVGAVLGECVIVNVQSSVGHDVVIGDYSTLSSHVDITGKVRIGRRVFVGSGARVLPGVTVGDDATIGAGAVVMKDVEPGKTVAGNPARVIG